MRSSGQRPIWRPRWSAGWSWGSGRRAGNPGGWDVAPNVTPLLTLRAGATCPDNADDTNGDGFIDAVEARASFGHILTAIDDNLTDQAVGEFVQATSEGELEATGTTSLEDLDASFRSEAGPFLTLPEDENMNLGSRTLVIQGVDQDESIPATVQTEMDRPVTETLPIGCAEIVPSN